MQYTGDAQDSCSVHAFEAQQRMGNGTTVKMVGVMPYRILHAASLHSSLPQSASHFTIGIEKTDFMKKTLSDFYDYSKLSDS